MILYILSLIGVSVFAISGALAAGHKGLDWVGVVALAVVTSLGGGTIRDILLNRDSVFWIQDPTYIWLILASSIFTIIYCRCFKPPMNALLIADALGLALFSVLGAQVAEAQGTSMIVIVIMGILTGVAGGVIRDILIGEIPLLFRSTETLYSVAALGGILAYLLFKNLEINGEISSWLGIIIAALLRFAAIFWKIKLPAFHIATK